VTGVWAALVALAGLAVVPRASGADGATVVVTPAVNPGKGWVLYGLPSDHTPEGIALGVTGYKRFVWSRVEPAEGRFDWGPIDRAVTEWNKAGKQFAFGVMAGNIHHRGMYVTPKWVFDAGCPARRVQKKRPASHLDEAAFRRYEGPQVIPGRWDHPVFLAKLGNLLAALAKRYDGDPRIAWCETRSYGNWGEGHLYPWGGEPLSHAGRYRHILMHAEAFRKTPLVTVHHYVESDRHYRRVVGMGIGIRDDGVMSFRDGSRTAGALGHSPGIFEWGGSYRQFARDGTWRRKGRTLAEVIENGKASYVGMARHGRADIKAFLAGEGALIRRLANRMGYHVVLTRAELPARIVPGAPLAVTFWWANRGVAHVYVPCHVALGLLDAKGRCVGRARVAGCNPAGWAPDKVTRERATATFEGVAPGTYRLAVGLFTRRRRDRPGIRLGLADVTADGWHPLVTVHVEAAPATATARACR
jgi:hypothetical protein